jgi:hypothetical protein
MMKNLSAAFLVTAFSTLGNIHLSADVDSDARQKLAELPNAPMIITMDQVSGSPSVILTDKGALINDSKVPVAYEKLLQALADLPKAAWHFGRIVVISPAPAGVTPAPKDVADKAELDMEKANIRLFHASQ